MADDMKRNRPLPPTTGRPGVSGAIFDAVEAVAKAFGPKSITQRRAKINQEVDKASDSPQTTDLGNQF